MESLQVSCAIFFACLFVVSQAAPMKKKDSGIKQDTEPTAETLSIEDALKALTQGTNQPPLVKGVTMSESKIETETNINGHKTSHSESETKIAKPSGKIIADVKTQMNAKQDGDQKPKIDSEIDVPDQGTQGQGKNPSLNPLDYSPRAVAEYLMVTGDYAGIMSGFQRLVDSGKITSEAATLDIETVMSEYSELVNEMNGAERPEEPVYYDEPVVDPTTEEMAELYLMNERLREEEEMAERMREPVIEDVVPEVNEEPQERVNEVVLRQSLTNLIDRIYDDLESGSQNNPVDRLTQKSAKVEAEIQEAAKEAAEKAEAEEEARAETEALESLSAARENERKMEEKKNADKKSVEKKSEEKKADKKSA